MKLTFEEIYNKCGILGKAKIDYMIAKEVYEELKKFEEDRKIGSIQGGVA